MVCVCGPHLRAAGQEGLDVDVGVVDLEVVVPQTAGHSYRRHDSRLPDRQINAHAQNKHGKGGKKNNFSKMVILLC